MQFFDYIISLQSFCINNQWIKAIYNWLEHQLIQDIQMYMKFTNFYQQFMEGLSQIAPPLIFILWLTSNFIANKLIFTKKDNINRVGVGKVIMEANIINKKSKTEFFILKAREAFANLRQAFNKAPILHDFDLKWHMQIEIHASGYAISKIFSHLTFDDSSRWHAVAFFFKKRS